MFHPEFDFGVPTSGELLAEFGLDPQTVREVIEHDRAIRCPDRDAVLPDPDTVGPFPRTPCRASAWSGRRACRG